MSYDVMPIEWSAQMRMDDARRQAQEERLAREARSRKERPRAQREVLSVVLALVQAPLRG